MMYSFSRFSSARADRLEDYWRNFAFLGLNEELTFAGGHKIEVRLLTLRMFVQLCAVRSPFFTGGRIGPEHIAQILWRLSPAYDTRTINREACSQFVESIASIPFKSAMRTINRYIDRMLIDKPPQRVGKITKDKADTSFAASMIHLIASNYGWSGEEILDLPLPRLFQYMRKIQRENDPKTSLWNPIRDRFTARWMTRFRLWKATQRQDGNARQLRESDE